MYEFFNGFSWGEILKTTTVLFAVIDIIGSIPIIIKLKESTGTIHEARTSAVSFFIMIGFFILGESILTLFGVTIEAFAVAGALIIFTLALEMILGVRLFRDEVTGKTASIVPLAFPIIAGAAERLAAIDVKLKGVNAKMNPSKGLYSNLFHIPGNESGCSL